MAEREDILEMLTELPTGLAQVGVTLGTGLAQSRSGGVLLWVQVWRVT